MAELRGMVRAVYSVGNVLVSAGHGEWLAQHVPGCEVVREQALGHLGDPDLLGERLDWLTDGA
jgi:hypothetical protein